MASMNTSSQRAPARGGHSGRHNPRGGVQKKGKPTPRVDRDGDMDMDGPIRGRGAPRGGRSSSTSQTRNGPHDGNRRGNRPPRNPFSTVKRTLENQDGNSRQAARFEAAMDQASKGFQKPGNRPVLSQLTVRGWTKSKAASNPGGCHQQLIEFLERKASNTGNPAERKNVRITKSHVDGDTLTISVNPDLVPSLLRIDTFTFAGAPLSIKEKSPSSHREGGGQPAKDNKLSDSGAELKERIKSMLERRYNAETKLLDLTALGADPEFANSGIFDSASTQSKFFPALMKVCNDITPTPAQKRDAISSVTLANNNLPDVATVTTLAQTFPDLKNLDMSNNNLRDLKAVDAWRRRFRSLEHLVLTGNPLETLVPNYHEEIIKWFPALRFLNGVQVRTEEQVAAASNGRIVVPVARPCFKDEAMIGENFLKFFFPNYDKDRAGLVSNFYDANATFSYSVNQSGKRVEEKTPDWNQYIKGSRNMLKITSLHGRKTRLNRGTDQIRNAWTQLPPTTHPDLAGESDKWCIECHPLAGLPDPNAAGGANAGVGGLIIYVHGEFGEVDVSNMQIKARRSFDRTFVLGPGAGFGGIRVISDMLVVRAYGGHDAWQPIVEETPVPQPGNLNNAAELIVPNGFGQPGPGKTDEMVQKERIAMELSSATRLTVEYSGLCLEQNDWNLEMAAQAFQEARATLPPEAFY